MPPRAFDLFDGRIVNQADAIPEHVAIGSLDKQRTLSKSRNFGSVATPFNPGSNDFNMLLWSCPKLLFVVQD